MKIALCLHGYFDSLVDQTSLGVNGYKYIKKHILSKGDVDVFIHSWDTKNANQIVDLYKPKEYIFEPQKDFSEIIKKLQIENLAWNARSPANVLSHFYSVQKSFTVFNQTRRQLEYSIVIKSRFDLGQINRNSSGPGKQNFYPVQCINFDPNLDMSKLYMAKWRMFDQGPPDMWFYSNARTMNAFSVIYTQVEEYLNWNSEYVKYHLRSNGEFEISNSVRLYKWWMQQNGLWENRVALDSEWE